MDKNGKINVEDILRADLVQTRRALSVAVTNHSNAAGQAAQLNAIVATLLYLRGDAAVEITDDDTQKAYEATWHRVRLDVVDPEDGTPNLLRVSLVPVTLDERKADQKLKKKADKKAAKKAAKKGPRLLGADGEVLDEA